MTKTRVKKNKEKPPRIRPSIEPKITLHSIFARRKWEIEQGTAVYQEMENQELLSELENTIFRR